MKKLLIGFMIVMVFAVSGFCGEKEFAKGSMFIIPQVLLDEFATQFGASVEYGLTENIGIGATIFYGSWSEDLLGWGKISQTLISPSVDAAYHFTKLAVKNLDVFAGAGIGFSIYSWSWDDVMMRGLDETGTTSLALTPFLGARYFFSDKIAVNLKFNYGALGDYGGFAGVIGAAIRIK